MDLDAEGDAALNALLESGYGATNKAVVIRALVAATKCSLKRLDSVYINATIKPSNPNVHNTMQVNAETLQPGQTIISPEGDCVTVASVKVKGYHVDVDCVGYPMLLLSKGELVELHSHDMTEMQAKKEGVKARKAGKPNAPALNPKFIAAACASVMSTAKLLDAYQHGWTVAMLAESATDKNLPSVQELAEIEAA